MAWSLVIMTSRDAVTGMMFWCHTDASTCCEGHPRSSSLAPIEKVICNFLLVINSNLAPILHHFQDMAFDGSKIAMFSYPCVFNLTPLTEGFPWDNVLKIFTERSRMTKVPNGVETLPKISIAWVGRTNVTHERQTDRRETNGRRHIANASSRSLKMGPWVWSLIHVTQVFLPCFYSWYLSHTVSYAWNDCTLPSLCVWSNDIMYEHTFCDNWERILSQ